MSTSLTWMTEWAALSKRISGLLKAGEFYIRCQPLSSGDSNQIARRELLPNSRGIFSLLGDFLERHRASLPAQAVASLEQFVERNKEAFDMNSEGHTNPEVRTQFRLTALASFQGEFSFNLADFEAATRRVTERAFSHLQRSIVADPGIRRKWENAFKKGEVPCEKLGAAHLLSHGIWAFKPDAAGERTDLVMGERLNPSEAEQVADGMVLTEWKLVRSPDVLQEKCDAAYRQAARYARGSLAGFELASYRFLVIVSKDLMPMPLDRPESGIQYKYVNIAVSPRPPSKV